MRHVILDLLPDHVVVDPGSRSARSHRRAVPRGPRRGSTPYSGKAVEGRRGDAGRGPRRPAVWRRTARASRRCRAHVVASAIESPQAHTCRGVGVPAASRVRPRAGAVGLAASQGCRTAEDAAVGASKDQSGVRSWRTRSTRSGKSGPPTAVVKLGSTFRTEHAVHATAARQRVLSAGTHVASEPAECSDQHRHAAVRSRSQRTRSAGSSTTCTGRSARSSDRCQHDLSLPVVRDRIAAVDQQVGVLPGPLAGWCTRSPRPSSADSPPA